MLNNDRVLHGHTVYTVTERMERRLESGYIAWDMARSRLNVLGKKKLNKDPVRKINNN